MDFLASEINNLKRKAPSQDKYIKRGELEARRQEEYLSAQERASTEKRKREEEKIARLKELEVSKRKKTELVRERSAIKEIDLETVQAELKGLGQPIRLFGESTLEIADRLAKIKASDASSGLLLESDIFTIPTDQDLPEPETLALGPELLKTQEGCTELCNSIFIYLRIRLHDWRLEQESANKSDDTGAKDKSSMYEVSRSHLSPLLLRLRAANLPVDILRNLETIVSSLRSGDYTRANHAYLQMSIGKAAWPVGVTMVSIHERALKARSHEELDSAHILADETTRQWLQSLKRLITHCEHAKPSMEK